MSGTSDVIGLPQYGQVPLVVSGAASTGMPHVGHVASCAFEIDTGLGLKHMVPT